LSRFADQTKVRVYAFTRQPSGDEFIIGRPESSAFLVIPRDAVDLLDVLAGGSTCREAVAYYRERYGETPDLAEFLEALHAKGFLAPELDEPAVTLERTPPRKPERPWISRRMAHALFNRFTALGALALMVAAIITLARLPILIPSRSSLVFRTHMAFFGGLLFGINLLTTFIHESAHLLAARAIGVKARIGIGNRLWILVAETDLSGLWAVPRSARFLPILAGPLIDAASASLLVLFLAVAGAGWRSSHPLGVQFVQALVMTYLLKLLWQCYLFVRTDFYYAFIMLFDCKNLMNDTHNFVKNQIATLLGRGNVVDQSSIPSSERRVIRWYALPWLMGRCLAFWILFWVQIPVMISYLVLVTGNLSKGYHSGRFMDTLLFSGIGCSMLFIGMFLWLRDIVKVRRASHARGNLAT